MTLRTAAAGLGLLVAGLAIGYSCNRPAPAAPPLPPDVVKVEVMREIPVEVPGPERVVERVEWRTRTEVVEGPERIQEVVRVVERAAELGHLEGQVELQAEKLEGLVGDELCWGWRGQARCQIRAAEADPWTVLVDQPLDLSSSTAISTLRPAAAAGPPWRRWELRLGATTAPGLDASISRRWRGLGGRAGWYVGAQLDLDPEVLVAGATAVEADDARAYAGLSWSWGR